MHEVILILVQDEGEKNTKPRPHIVVDVPKWAGEDIYSRGNLCLDNAVVVKVCSRLLS